MWKIEKIVVSPKKRLTHTKIAQSAMAGLYIFPTFLIMHLLHSDLTIASLGASAFIAFSSPSNQSSRSQLLFGGYCVGAFTGLLCGGLVFLAQNFISFPVHVIACALAVFLSMLLMTVLNLEHPPSTALAVAVTIAPNPITTALAGLGGIVALCILMKLLKKHLRNL